LADIFDTASAAGAHTSGWTGAPRRHKAHADKCPGPLLQIFQAPIPAQSELNCAMPTADRSDSPEALADKLADLDSVFDAIRRAQSFQLCDGRFDADWQQLSQQADALAAQIRNQLDAGPRTMLDGPAESARVSADRMPVGESGV
jgi:hypothetical protein